MAPSIAPLWNRFREARAEYRDHISDFESGRRDIFGRKTRQGQAEDKERRLKARAGRIDEERERRAKHRHIRHHHGRRSKAKSEKRGRGSAGEGGLLGGRPPMRAQNPGFDPRTGGDGTQAAPNDDVATRAAKEYREHFADGPDADPLPKEGDAPVAEGHASHGAGETRVEAADADLLPNEEDVDEDRSIDDAAAAGASQEGVENEVVHAEDEAPANSKSGNQDAPSALAHGEASDSEDDSSVRISSSENEGKSSSSVETVPSDTGRSSKKQQS